MIREALQSVARNQTVADVIGRVPGARGVVGRLVAGESIEDAMDVAVDLADRGYWLSLEHTQSGSQPDPEAALDDLYELIDAIDDAGVTGISELSIRPEALGATFEEAMPRLQAVCASARVHDLYAMVGMAPSMDVDQMHAWFATQGEGIGAALETASVGRRGHPIHLHRRGHRQRLARLATNVDPNEAVLQLQLKRLRCIRGLNQSGNARVQKIIERVQVMLNQRELGISEERP